MPIDLVIVRENTEDLYAGIEFEGQGRTAELIEVINAFARPARSRPASRRTGISIKPISVEGSERIIRCAFDYARENKRKKVTAVHKANIMKHTDGLFLEVARKVAKEYTDIDFEDRIVDNMCMQLVQKPELYDVLVLPNSVWRHSERSGRRTGGRAGRRAGREHRSRRGRVRSHPRHAPKYKGLNKVNPTAVILSGMLMLRHLGEKMRPNGWKRPWPR